jgi:hypothetical protein
MQILDGPMDRSIALKMGADKGAAGPMVTKEETDSC